MDSIHEHLARGVPERSKVARPQKIVYGSNVATYVSVINLFDRKDKETENVNDISSKTRLLMFPKDVRQRE